MSSCEIIVVDKNISYFFILNLHGLNQSCSTNVTISFVSLRRNKTERKEIEMQSLTLELYKLIVNVNFKIASYYDSTAHVSKLTQSVRFG